MMNPASESPAPVFPLEIRGNLATVFFQGGHGGVAMDAVEHAFEAFLQGLDQIPVHPGQEAAGDLDERHPASELRVDGAQLQTDDPAADGQQTIRDVLQFERSVRIQDLRTVNGEDRRRRRPGARGDDGMDEVNMRDVVIPGNADPAGSLEGGAAADPRNPAAFAKGVEAARELREDSVFPLPHFDQIDLRFRKRQSARRRFSRFGDQTRDVKQGLGRDATPEQARAPEAVVGLHQGYGNAEVRRSECGGVAAGPAADHEEVGLVGYFRHDRSGQVYPRGHDAGRRVS